MNTRTQGTSAKADRFTLLRYAAILIVAFAAGTFYTWQLTNVPTDGIGSATGAIYLLLIAALGLAVYRRNQILKLQDELVRQQAQEIQLTHAALNAHALVCLTNQDGIITSVNENFTKRFGYAEDELIGQPVSMIYPDGDADPTFIEVGRMLAKGDIWTGESEELAADGSKVVMRCTIVPMMDDNGKHVRTVAIRTDNTAYRRAEKARFLKSLFDHLQDEVYVYRVDSLQMVYANNCALKACDWDPGDLSSLTIIDADSKMNEQAFRAHVSPLFNGDCECVSVEVNRGEASGEIRTRLVRADDGETLFVSVLRDTTERKKTERARMESVSVVSHELRTPLTSIKGALRLLNSGALGGFDEKAKSVLEIAVRNTERLLLVVDDILDLEKIRAGKMKMDKSEVDLVSFVEDVVEMNKGYGEELHVNFDFNTSLKSAQSMIAPDRMMQVLANLLSNAAKYSPTDGTVRIGLRDDGDFWRISVSDDGPGIPEEGRDSVFDRFSQLASTDGKSRKGTGLGLTISRKIVLAHAGEIDFDSEVGKGTTFFVRLRKRTGEADDDLEQGDSAPLSDVA